jgi:hypothetical protein
VFILKGDKVLCFDTLLQVLILKVDSGAVGALAQFVALSILLGAIFLENVGGKGVRWLAGYFMGYYTIWLASCQEVFCPVLGMGGLGAVAFVFDVTRKADPSRRSQKARPGSG